VLGIGKYPKQLDPKSGEKNRQMPGLADQELSAYVRRIEGTPGVDEQVDRLVKRLKKARQVARKNIHEGKQKQRAYHNKKATKVEYFPGQLVYRKQMVKGRKCDPKWTGPYQIERKVSDLVYQVRVGSRTVNLNAEQLKLCRASRDQLRSRRRRRREIFRRENERNFHDRSNQGEVVSSSEDEEEENSVYESRTSGGSLSLGQGSPNLSKRGPH
jgi:hypothetical protein